MHQGQSSTRTAIKDIVSRLLFAYLAAVILVFFSEKTYWYVQGFDVLGLALFYFFPTYLFLWAVERFQVSRLAPLFLAAAFYGFLVEGVLASILYQDGPFGWFHISYTSLAWHAPLSVGFGFYFLRKWLLQNNVRWLLGSSLGFGLFWGTWSITNWLPENLTDPELVEAGLSVWPSGRFALYAFFMTLIFAAAHWLIGRVWPTKFASGKVEMGIVLLYLAVDFVFMAIIPFPIAWLKLPLLLAIVLFALRHAARHAPSPSLFVSLRGQFPLRRTLWLMAMPATASAIYGAAFLLQPSEEIIRDLIYLPVVFGQTAIGWLLFLWALIYVAVRSRRRTA